LGSSLPLSLRTRLNESTGDFAGHGQFALRAWFVNHRTTPADVAQIVPEVLKAIGEISKR
jgi:hypothetical protein